MTESFPVHSQLIILVLVTALWSAIHLHMQVMAALPHLQPSVLGFGGLADGFLPVPLPHHDIRGQGEQSLVQVPMCSLVMKAVQASMRGSNRVSESTSWLEARDTPASKTLQSHQPCAVKLGDGSLGGKIQLDPRLPKDVQQAVLQTMQRMVQEGARLVAEQHGDVLASVLRQMYVDVTRKQLLVD
jgi:hypothetical protein